MKRLRSLRARLVAAALALVAVALLAAGLGIAVILTRFVGGQIDERLDAQVTALRAGFEAGTLAAHPERFDGPPFDRPGGWVWEVRSGTGAIRSESLEGHAIALGRLGPAGEGERPRPAEGRAPGGGALLVRLLALPGATILVGAPQAAAYGPLRDVLASLALALGLLGLFLAAGAVAQVRLGLAPLKRLRDGLAAVREGREARLPGHQPKEIRPLVAELNALLEQNERNLDRARGHVANLAHALKTPLATLAMALRDPALDPGGRLAAQVDDMDRRVRHHLRRARAAALAGPARARTPLLPRLADLREVLLRIHAERRPEIALAVPEDTSVACEGQDLDEMLGNLLDNACRWCAGTVRVAAERAGGQVEIRIEDDGPGLASDAASAMLERGRRLDEGVPGDGFGLPITLELAELYGGSLSLGRSSLGGLRATLRLPG
ncbi:sensor histidine kinase [Methylobacterium sp. J-076]|uniref:sensor histidine kinase n=1 Tax=Methylobacterium sp. J-076 TaxID=2836655 RepID=UPI001FBAA323|nr:ATP-binding protein [Methylobacterium sp. J-076]MCJ2014326.1 ATP-binding protein [Methylobacterium sp. J-076]